jgi:hypothetical protein
MPDRHDDDPDLESMLSELAETLSALQNEVESSRPPQRPPMHPPSIRDVMRFTEQQTIPTLVAILEANVRLLELAGAALRAIDPERSMRTGSNADSALSTASGISTERLTSGLSDLRSALAGAEATNPEARELLAEADRLSAALRERFENVDSDPEQPADTPAGSTDAVSIDVVETGEESDEDEDSPAEPDIDAELDSIRDEVHGKAKESPDERADEGAEETGASTDDDEKSAPDEDDERA